MDEYENHLSGETSPYLRQHAGNPVDWYPWGDDAFERASRDDKPVFLSIGYSTCHWCHVMARESFEDSGVASLLNESFICVKVDREERPDIDGVYMDAAVLMTGRGGWPLTIVMTPDGKPFYAATYLPRESRLGMPGLVELLPRISELWRDRRPEILDTASRVEAALSGRERSDAPRGAGVLDGRALPEAVIDTAEQSLAASFDERHGGFGSAPKFPSPHNVLFLLQRWSRTGNERLLSMATRTLDAMMRGGIYDHVGFGFHRYSTDERWLVPHFEKMLYDQAMLTMAYAEAAAETGNPDFARTARETVRYVIRDLTSPEGAFYAAEDADSEGVEGRFYVWTIDELREALDPGDAELAISVFGASDQGNAAAELAMETGTPASNREGTAGSGGRDRGEGPRRDTGPNVLHLPRPLDQVAGELGVPEEELRSRLDSIRERLRTRRDGRVRPHRDEKVLTDWNALMVWALSVAARRLNEPSLADAAGRGADFILSTMRDGDGRLLHARRGTRAGVRATANDYAFLVAALLDLYDSTPDSERLLQAERLNAELVDGFWDERGGGFYFTAHDAERLLFRRKDTYDGAVPSANSVALRNLVRLSEATGEPAHGALASRLQAALLPLAAEAPTAYTMFLSSVDHANAPADDA